MNNNNLRNDNLEVGETLLIRVKLTKNNQQIINTEIESILNQL